MQPARLWGVYGVHFRKTRPAPASVPYAPFSGGGILRKPPAFHDFRGWLYGVFCRLEARRSAQFQRTVVLYVLGTWHAHFAHATRNAAPIWSQPSSHTRSQAACDPVHARRNRPLVREAGPATITKENCPSILLVYPTRPHFVKKNVQNSKKIFAPPINIAASAFSWADCGNPLFSPPAFPRVWIGASGALRRMVQNEPVLGSTARLRSKQFARGRR